MLTIWRVLEPLRVLEEFGDPAADAGGGLHPPLTEEDPRFDRLWRVTVRGGKRPGTPRIGAGLYLVEVRRGGESVRCAVSAYDLAAVVKRSSAEILVFVTDARTGLPVTGARVVLAGRDVRRVGATGASGVLRTSLGAQGPVRVLADADGRLARPTVVRAPSSAGAGAARLHLETDRPLYRPGETVRYRGVARLRTSDGFRVPDLTPVRVRAYDTEGFLLAEGVPDGTGRGSFWGAFRLPPETTPGAARLETETSAGTFSTPIPVAVPEAPPAELSLRCDPAVPDQGEEAEVRIRARDRFGRGLAGAPVRFEVEYVGTGERPLDPFTVTVGEGRLDGEGTLRTGFFAAWGGTYRIRAETRTEAGESLGAGLDVEVPLTGFRLEVESESRHLPPGAEARVRIRPVVQSPPPRPLSGEVLIGDEVLPFAVPVDRSATGAEVRFVLETPGRHTIRAKAIRCGFKESEERQATFVVT